MWFWNLGVKIDALLSASKNFYGTLIRTDAKIDKLQFDLDDCNVKLNKLQRDLMKALSLLHDLDVQVVGERGDGMLIFNVVLPPKSAFDVVSREVVVALAGSSNTYVIPGDQNVIEDLSGPQNEDVTVTLVDIDDSENRSVARTATVKLLDTVAPPQPGEIGINVVDEVPDSPSVDVPVVDTPVVDTPVVEEPVVDTPVVDVPVVDTPVVEEPVVDTPVTDEPPAL